MGILEKSVVFVDFALVCSFLVRPFVGISWGIQSFGKMFLLRSAALSSSPHSKFVRPFPAATMLHAYLNRFGHFQISAKGIRQHHLSGRAALCFKNFR